MIDEILIDAGPRRRRVALLTRGRLLELYLVVPGERHPERIIIGRVKTVQADLDAAFIDIGEAREALLPARDAAAKRGTPISRAVHEGENVMVQVKREAEGEKGARVSARLRLTGKALVFLPLGHDAELSSRIKDPDQRQRLQTLAGTLRDRHGGGLILRSGAVKYDDAALEGEAGELCRCWQAIQTAAASAKVPLLLDLGDDPMAAILREHAGPSLRRIRVADSALASELQAVWSEGRPAIKMHDGAGPLFGEYDLEAPIETALATVVALPSGGRIIIEHTQALTAVDVDSGQSANASGAGDPGRLARETNTEAAREIARQLRLREIGGRVVIDFIPMRGKGEVAALLKKFQGFLDDDPGGVHLGRMSELGLVELTRRRRQPALVQRLGEICTPCAGSGLRPTVRYVADNLLQRILRESHAAKGRALDVRAAVAVVADLGGQKGEVLIDLDRERGCRVRLTADPALALEEFEVTTI